MGAAGFFDFHPGDDVEVAFREAVKSAQYEFGHAGYTGTIAEKESYLLFEREFSYDTAMHLAETMLSGAGDPRVADKWGPAGAFRVVSGEYGPGFLFFGFASA